MISSLLYLFFLNSLVLISVIGLGKLIIFLTKIRTKIIDDFKSIEFYFGLIFIGCYGIILNFFYTINFFISLSIIVFGFILFIIFFIEKFKNKKDIYSLIIIIIISILFSYFSVLNDDYDYHFNTIENFKEIILINDLLNHPSGGNRVAYNSHWLMINAVTYFKSLPVTLFAIGSLIYGITIYDLFYSIKRNYFNKKFLPSIYSTLVLLFLIGVINSYKEYGTDFPGQLVIIIITLIFFEHFNNYKLLNNKEQNSIFIIVFFLALLSFSIKISNVFILFLLVFIFLKVKNKLKVFIFSLLSSIPLTLWIIQNYIISKCLIWPIALLCHSNISEAKKEKLIIEATAKGVAEGYGELEIMIKDFNWLPIWLNDHFYKILGVYGFYTLLITIPIIVFYLLNYKTPNIKIKLTELVDFSSTYLIFIFLTFFSSIFWFLEAPVHRFGIIYNLNFILIFLIPFWVKVLSQNYNFYIKSVRILFMIAAVFFTAEMISKQNKYIDRHGYVWPNIKEGILYEKFVP